MKDNRGVPRITAIRIVTGDASSTHSLPGLRRLFRGFLLRTGACSPAGALSTTWPVEPTRQVWRNPPP